MRTIAFLVAAAFIAVVQTAAAPIPTLFSTGVDNSGVRLADEATELHYSLVSFPSGSSSVVHVRRESGGYPVGGGTWLNDASSPSSAWIGPAYNHVLYGPVGNYTYRTTFDLTGFTPTTAQIAGKWSSDNNGVVIRLNGVAIGNGYPTSFTQFSLGYVDFSIDSGFVSGLNTLDFVVYNGGAPTGLRVELTGTALPAVPEPSTFAAGLAALGMFGLIGWRSRK